MKKSSIILLAIIWIGIGLISACSSLDGQCIIRGQFTNLSDGELYFYMPDGPRDKVDTVTIREGKFNYAIADAAESYSIMLFPNMSEQVVFIEPDLEIKIEANATQLRDTKITGGKANKLMTAFRTETRDLSGDGMQEKVLKFIQDNPASVASIYLLKRYLINVEQPEVEQIRKAIGFIAAAQPDLASIKNLSASIEAWGKANKGQKAPDFSVTDYQGVEHKLADYKNKQLLLIFGATWADGYRDELRTLKKDLEERQEKPEIVNVVLDLTRPLFRTVLRDSVPGSSISALRGWEADIVKTYQIKSLPTYILIDKNQQIVAREESWNSLKSLIK